MFVIINGKMIIGIVRKEVDYVCSLGTSEKGLSLTGRTQSLERPMFRLYLKI